MLQKKNFLYLSIFCLIFFIFSNVFYLNNDDYWIILQNFHYPIIQHTDNWIPGRVLDNFFSSLNFKFLYKLLTSLPLTSNDFFKLFSYISLFNFVLTVFLTSYLLHQSNLEKKYNNNILILTFYLITFLAVFKSNNLNSTLAYGLNNLIVIYFLFKILPINSLNNNSYKNKKSFTNKDFFLLIIFSYLSAFTIEYLVAFSLIYIIVFFLINYYFNKNFSYVPKNKIIILSIFIFFSLVHFFLSINSGRYETYKATTLNDSFIEINYQFLKNFFLFFSTFFIIKIKFYFTFFFFLPFLILLYFIISKKINLISKKKLINYFTFIITIFFLYLYFLSSISYANSNSFLPIKLLIIIFYFYCCGLIFKKNIWIKIYLTLSFFFFFCAFLYKIIDQNIERSIQYNLVNENFQLLVESCHKNQSIIYTTANISKTNDGFKSLGYMELPTEYSPQHFKETIKKTIDKFYNCSFDKIPIFINNK
jgi:hypothetical protein